MRVSESDTHQQAKIILAQHLRHREPAQLVLGCSMCGTMPYPEDPDSEDIYEVLPDYDEVELEYLLPINRRADMVLLKDGKPVFLIEVRRKNKVNAPKLEQLNRLGIPWVEIAAADVIVPDFEPIWWVERSFLGVRQLCCVCEDQMKKTRQVRPSDESE